MKLQNDSQTKGSDIIHFEVMTKQPHTDHTQEEEEREGKGRWRGLEEREGREIWINI